MILFYVFVVLHFVSSQGPLTTTFQQPLSQRWTFRGSLRLAEWPELPVTKIQSVDSLGDNSFFILSSSGLFQGTKGAFQNVTNHFRGLPFSGGRLALLSKTALWIVAPSSFYYCVQNSDCTVTQFNFGTVNDVAVDFPNQRLFIATNKGFFWASTTKIQLISLKNSSNFLSTTVGQDGTIVAATPDFLWRTLEPGNLNSFHFFRTPGIIDATPQAMEFDRQGYLWIANAVCINVQAPDLTFTRYGGNDGVPTNNFTSIGIDQVTGDVWIGSQQGLVRFKRETEEWLYYFGPRYLPGKNIPDGQSVSMVLAFADFGSERQVAVVTDGGLAWFKLHTMTLQEKANVLDEQMEKYFFETSPQPHPYRGYLTGSGSLQKYGNMSSWMPGSSDNNGLWTAVYLAGECFKYALTKDPKVKERAWKYFEGMEFLNTVTGVEGLMARSVLYQNTFPHGGKWVHSKTAPGWIWKADCSSDEVVGHMMVYPIVYHLLAETSSEKARVYKLIDSITRYIIVNGYRLIDYDGQPTTWGHWEPQLLNDDPEWYDERGTGAMQILSWIISAYSITGDTFYLNAFKTLTNDHKYHINIVNAKITQPSDDNFSDDELLYLPYLTYIFAMEHMGSKSLVPDISLYFDRSIERSQKSMTPYRPTAWNWIYYMYKRGKVDASLISGSIQTLQEWVIEPIGWPCDNTQRLDIHYNLEIDRSDDHDIIELLPYNERGHQRWNADPYHIPAQREGGRGITDPGAFIFGYWGCEWVGLGQ